MPKIFISPFKGGSTSIAEALDLVGFKRWNSNDWVVNFTLHQKEQLALIERANKLLDGINEFNEIDSKTSNEVETLIGKNLRELFGNYDVADDYPLGHDSIHPFIKKIVFSQGKFIFSERPIDEYFESVFKHVTNKKYKHIYSRSHRLYCFERTLAKKLTIEKYKKWKSNYINLKKSFPDDVLIMDLEDGWEPLATFLGFEVPDIEFPRLNVSVLDKDPCLFFLSCEHEYLYCEKYDSEYCPVCLEWRDDTCGEEKCTICKKRPDRPIIQEAD